MGCFFFGWNLGESSRWVLWPEQAAGMAHRLPMYWARDGVSVQFQARALSALGPLPPPLLPPSQESQLSILSQGAPHCPNTPAQVPTYIPACPPHYSGLPGLPEHLHRNQAHGSGGRTLSVWGPRIVAQSSAHRLLQWEAPVCGRVAGRPTINTWRAGPVPSLLCCPPPAPVASTGPT